MRKAAHLTIALAMVHIKLSAALTFVRVAALTMIWMGKSVLLLYSISMADTRIHYHDCQIIYTNICIAYTNRFLIRLWSANGFISSLTFELLPYNHISSIIQIPVVCPSAKPHQSPLGSGSRPSFSSGLCPVVWSTSASNWQLYHQPKLTVLTGQTHFVLTEPNSEEAPLSYSLDQWRSEDPEFLKMSYLNCSRCLVLIVCPAHVQGHSKPLAFKLDMSLHNNPAVSQVAPLRWAWHLKLGEEGGQSALTSSVPALQ